MDSALTMKPVDARNSLIYFSILTALVIAVFRGPLTFLIGNLATIAVALPMGVLFFLIDWRKALPALRRPEVIGAIALIAWAAIKIPFSDSLWRGALGFAHLAFPVGAYLVFLALMTSARLRPSQHLQIAVIVSTILCAGVAVEVYFDQPLSSLVQHRTPADVAAIFAPFRVGSFIGASLPFGVVLGLLLPFAIVAAVRLPNLLHILLVIAFLPMIVATYGRGAMMQAGVAGLAIAALLLVNRWTTPSDQRRQYSKPSVSYAAGVTVAIITILPFMYGAIPNSISARFESGIVSVCRVASLAEACSSIVSLQTYDDSDSASTCDTVLEVTSRRGDDVDADALYDRCMQAAAEGLDVSSISRFEVYNAMFAYMDTWPKRLFGGSLMASGNFVKYFNFDYLIPGVEASESYYLKLYTEVGIVGLVVFLALMIFIIGCGCVLAFKRPKTAWNFIGIASSAALVGLAPEMLFLQSLENPVVAIIFGWVMAVGAYSWRQNGEGDDGTADVL